MTDNTAAVDPFHGIWNIREPYRLQGTQSLWRLLIGMIFWFHNAVLAQAPPPPPEQLAELIEVRVVSSGGDGRESGRGWAVQTEIAIGAGCEVLTPWHVVSDKLAGRMGMANPVENTRVYGVEENIRGVRAVAIEQIQSLDLARVTLDSKFGCPFQAANQGRLPERGLVVWWLNDRGGVNRLDGDLTRGVQFDNETGDIAKAYLGDSGGIRRGISGATVFVNGRRAGMLINTPGMTDRFNYITAEGIQRALGPELRLFDLDSRIIAHPSQAEPAFPFIHAREDASSETLAPRLTDESGLRELALFKDCADCPEMVVIPEGNFQMGSPEDEPQRDVDEDPRHWVSVKRFALARNEVTVAEFRQFVDASGYRTDAEKNAGQVEGCRIWDGSKWAWVGGRSWRDPAFAQNDDEPVACISWNDAQAYVEWLSERTGREYRLPSEAEWEYAARAGTTTRFHTGECITTDQANFNGKFPASGCPEGEYRGQTMEVGSFEPNEFGLYDMHGNVWEWVADCWNGSYEGAPEDGSAWRTGDCGRAVLRGGSWDYGGLILRSAFRIRFTRATRDNGTGFRPARSVAL